METGMDPESKVNSTNCLPETSSKVTEVIKYSEALRRGATGASMKLADTGEYEIKHCQFCDKELEVEGIYFISGFMKSKWLSMGNYERCTCQAAQEYWKKHDDEELQRKLAEEKAEAKRLYQERLQRMIKKSKLGQRFMDRTFANYKVNSKNSVAFEKCKKYADTFKKLKENGIGIMLIGNYGTGKTHLAAAIAHELIKQGYQPIFGTLINLLERIRSTYDDYDTKETEQQIINSYISCDLLIIDDLGKEKPSEWTLDRLYNVVNTRYEDNKPIIITTNYDIDELKDRLTVKDNFKTAHAIVSRIFETCQGINLQGEDYRLHAI